MTVKLKYLIGVIGLSSVGFVGSAHAEPITFTHTGIGTGSIGTTNFVNSFFTITEITDTTLRKDCGTGGACFYMDDLEASISIGGLSYSFLTPTRTFVDQDIMLAGFARAGAGGQDLLDGPISRLLANYSMLTSIGPVAGSGDLLQFQDPADPVFTSGGRLLFNDQTGPVTFQAIATAVPEPSTLLFLTVGLLGVGLRYRKPKPPAASPPYVHQL